MKIIFAIVLFFSFPKNSTSQTVTHSKYTYPKSNENTATSDVPEKKKIYPKKIKSAIIGDKTTWKLLKIAF